MSDARGPPERFTRMMCPSSRTSRKLIAGIRWPSINRTDSVRVSFPRRMRGPITHGATMNDVVKVVTYVTDVRNLPEAGKCRTETLGGAPQPVHTFLNINQLAWPGMLVEVDVIAATAAP